MSLPKVKMKKRGAYCFICGTIEDEENHRFGTFEVNTKRLSEWEKLIPKPGLKIRSAICGRHFDVDDIIKGREIGGVFQPFKIWKLKDLAVPKHLLCRPVDSLADCSQAKKGGPKIRNPFADCNKENRKSLASKSDNNGGTHKRIPLSDSITGNRQPLISKASNNGALINLASPREPSEIIDRIIPMDENVPVANNLFEAAQVEGSVTLHDFGAIDFPILSERPAPTESEATDACSSSMDHEPSDQGEGNVAVRDHGVNDLPTFSERPVPTVSEATDACSSSMEHEPTLNSAESESVSADPKTSSSNDPSDVPSSANFNFDTLKRIIKLPTNWRWDDSSSSCYSAIKSGKEFVHKIVFITSLLLTFFVNGREIIFPFIRNCSIWKPHDLQRAIYEFDIMRPCPGMLDPSLHTYLNVKGSKSQEAF